MNRVGTMGKGGLGDTCDHGCLQAGYSLSSWKEQYTCYEKGAMDDESGK